MQFYAVVSQSTSTLWLWIIKGSSYLNIKDGWQLFRFFAQLNFSHGGGQWDIWHMSKMSSKVYLPIRKKNFRIILLRIQIPIKPKSKTSVLIEQYHKGRQPKFERIDPVPASKLVWSTLCKGIAELFRSIGTESTTEDCIRYQRSQALALITLRPK